MKAYAANGDLDAIKNYLDLLDEDLTTVDTVIKTGKAHIHNHIYWNAVTLDCKRKFRNFRNSSKAIARLSDLICTEHQLSVITNPQRGSSAYNKWHGFKGKPSHAPTAIGGTSIVTECFGGVEYRILLEMDKYKRN